MSLQSCEMVATLLGLDLDISLQIQWVLRLATACKLDLLILESVESTKDCVVEVPLDTSLDTRPTGVISKLMQIIEDSPELRAGSRQSTEMDVDEYQKSQLVYVCFKRIQFTSLHSLRRLLLDELRESKTRLFTLARKQLLNNSDVDLFRERRLFYRYLPYDVVLCQGLVKDKSLSRILVAASSGPNGKAALQLSLDLTGARNGSLTVLHVNPSVGPDAEQVGERRLDRVLRNLLGTEHPALTRRVVIDNQVQHGIRQVWDEGITDLIVEGLPRSHIEVGILPKLGKEVTVAIVSAASPIANRLKEFLEESILRFIPQIEREDRISLVDRVQSSAAWNFDFITLMVLSTIMCAIGLIQSSTAVVIGAMLVAPLMTPLLGLGLAFVQGNPVLARMSLFSIAFGLCISLLGGFLVGFCTPNFEEPTIEMLIRGGPGLLDLILAFAAGLAAAYASSRPGLIAALPGVAIAAALVPPIATSGLALSLGNFTLAFGALLLFGINMVAIVIASMMSLWAVGIRNLKKTSRWVVIGGSALIISVMALGIYLSLLPRANELTEQIPAGMVEEVQGILGIDYKLDSLAVAYDELGVQLNLIVVGKEPAHEKLANDVRALASDHYDQPVRVRLLTRIAIEVNPIE